MIGSLIRPGFHLTSTETGLFLPSLPAVLNIYTLKLLLELGGLVLALYLDR